MKRLILFIISALLLCACSKEFTEDNLIPTPEPQPGNTKRVELMTNGGEYALPKMLRSGSADEYSVGGTPWVIVFHGSGNSAVFYEAVQSIQLGSKTYVSLTETDSPCRVLIIANAPSTFYNGSSEVAFNAVNLTNYFTGSGDYATAVSGFTTSMLTSPVQTLVPYTSVTDPKPLLPMSTSVDLSQIDNATTLGATDNKLILNRIVAKVTVECNQSDAVLLGATIVNAPRNGTFIQNGSVLKNNTSLLTDYLTALGDQVTGISEATNNNTFLNPIYIYESRVQENTGVIVELSYQGTTYYYKLAFKIPGTTAPTNVLRNKYYRFVINNIKSPGYTSLEEAKTAPFSNIDYGITVTDQLSYDISDNGQYYLGLSNSEYRLYTSYLDPGNDLLAFTITTNATQGISSSIVVTSGANSMSVSQSTVNLATSPASTASTDVKIHFVDDALDDCVVTIKLGTLTKNIIVKQIPIFEVYAATIPLSTNYVSGYVASGSPWLTLSAVGVTPSSIVKLPSPGTINLNISERPPNVSSDARSGEAYLSRDNNQGRLKICVRQYGLVMHED